MFSYVAVDCGFPSIPEDGILQVVQTHKGHTLYKDQIRFKCSSEYYMLEGPGNLRLRQHLISKSHSEMSPAPLCLLAWLSSSLQTRTLAVLMVNGYQLVANQSCQSALKVHFQTLSSYFIDTCFCRSANASFFSMWEA